MNEALEWWESMPLSTQFYTIIESNQVIEGDHTRHPSSLSNEEIEKVYNFIIQN